MEQPRPRRFEVVDSLPDEPEPQKSDAGTNLLLLALRALSQRAIVAIADLFMLLTVTSAFWLWHSIPEPNPFQIISLTIYAVFVLAANYIVRKIR